MKNKFIGMYITDDYIFFCTKDKIYKEKVLNKAVLNNRINKSVDFFKQLNQIIKKNKLNDSIISKTIYIVNLPIYLESDREIISSILEKASFTKIRFVDYKDLIEKKHMIININNKNVLISKSDQYIYMDNSMYESQKDEKSIIYLIKKCIDNNAVYLIGNNSNLGRIRYNLEKKLNKKAYIYDNSDIYIIFKLKEKMVV